MLARLGLSARVQRKASLKASWRSVHSVAPKAPIDFVSFSGCGFLIPFHVGVLKALKKHDLLAEHTVFAGASGGALVAGTDTRIDTHQTD